INRDASRSPLFDVMFLLQNMEIAKIEIPGLKLKPFEYENDKAKFDLMLQAMEMDGELEFKLVYSTTLFKEATIRRYATYFKRILSAVPEEPGRKLAKIELLAPEEKQQLLYDFNDTVFRYPKEKALHRLFEEQVERTPDRIALVGPATGGTTQETQLTYRRLKDESHRQAAALIWKGLEPGTIVGIMAERSIEVITGILGILTAGAAYMPMDPDYPQERIQYMLKDSGAKILLKGTDTPPFTKQPDGLEILDLSAIKGTVKEDMGDETKLAEQFAPGDQSTPLLSYIIYTSGSTGKPKGVMVEHPGVVNLAYYQKKRFKIKTDDRVLQFSSLCFDASVEQLFITLFSGAALVLAAKETLMDNRGFDGFTARHGLTHIHAVPSFLQNMGLKNVYSLRRVISGGDVCPPELAKTWRHRCEFYNEYGPTETTVTSIEMEVKDAVGEVTRLPVGKPIGNTGVYLLDKNLKPVPKGAAGELYIGGEGITRGYLNRPELTHERFIPNPFIKLAQKNAANIHSTPVTSPLIYKTGDLCCWQPDDNLQFLDRLDNQVKIRGYRIELGEIESLLSMQERVSEAVVKSWKGSDEENYLCAYVVYTKKPADTKTTADKNTAVTGTGIPLRELLSKTLPDYMIPSFFVTVDKMPLTPTGKIDRKALPEPSTEGVEVRVAPRNTVEEKLAETWSQLLEIDKNHIGIDDNFFHLGGHSLKATRMIAKIHNTLNVTVPLTELFAKPTIRTLSAYIETASPDKFLSIKAVEKKEYYSLSSAQKRMYLLQQMERNGTGYNMPLAVLLEGTLDREHLEKTFRKLIDRHESLRTSFEMRDEEIVQVIHKADELEFCFQYEEISGGVNTENVIFENFVRSFDLSRAPLMRVGVIKKENAGTSTPSHVLLLDMHHIISDGVSFGIFVRDFMTLFKGEELPPLHIQYKEFSEWRNRLSETPEMKKQYAWWQQKFEKEIEVLELPYDYPRPPQQSFAGSSLSSEITKKKTAAINELALKEGGTLFMAMLALYNVFLSRLTHREDIVVGVPTAGRSHADLEPVIGMFVNTLPLRSNPGGGKTFKRFLQEVAQQTLLAFENQALPFEELVEQLEIERSLSRNPLFDVMFTLNNIEVSRVEIPGLSLSLYKRENKIAKFDLTFSAREVAGKILLEYDYCTALFNEKTVRRFDTIFQRIIDEVLETPDIRLEQIDIVPEEEKRRILFEYNDTTADYPLHKTIQELFEEQVARTPDQNAVTGMLTALSFRELDEAAGSLAYTLHRQGVVENVLLGILTRRSVEMIIGILGILKAGCGYVPLNPEAPAERNKYVLEESAVNHLLTTRELTAISAEIGFEGNTICLEPWTGCGSKEKEQDTFSIHPPSSSLAYVIFTSGSTGKPKGVPITHANLSPLLHWGYKELGIGHNDRALQNLSYYFDWSVWEIFITLTTGACLYMISQELQMNPEACAAFIHEKKITLLHVTPTQWQYMVAPPGAGLVKNETYESLKYLFIGAEKLNLELVERSIKKLDEECRIFNMYGPTEATIISAVLEIDKKSTAKYINQTSVPIGVPVGNTALLVLDRHLKPVPLQVEGELYIAGDGVAQGYLNNPEMTSEKFINHNRPVDSDLLKLLRRYSKLLPEGQSRVPESRRGYIYKTGDRARWLPDGTVEFLGRFDSQVKIRGFRIELGEIERQLLTGKEVKEAVVVAREEKKGEPYLCAYYVAHSPVNGDTIRKYLQEKLPPYMIPAYFVPIESIPLAPNGKVDYKTLPEPGHSGAGEEQILPRNEIEEKLAGIWAEVLGKPKNTLGIDTVFFHLGGHSLKATLMAAKIRKTFNTQIPLTAIFKTPTIREMAEYIKEAAVDRYAAIEVAEKKEYYPLSPAQSRLYILQQMDAESTGYNISSVLELAGSVHKERLEETFGTLIARHESLRTTFEMKALIRQRPGDSPGETFSAGDFMEETPGQVIHPRVDFKIEYENITKSDRQPAIIHGAVKRLIRPFALSRAPLMRVGLIKVEDKKHLLIVDIHHIISDGTSYHILVKEFLALFNGEEVPELRIQYKDYTQWKNSVEEKEALKKQEAYWLRQFENEIPVLNLPVDYPRPAAQGFEGSNINFEIAEEDTRSLEQYASKKEVTLFMILLAVIDVFLAKISSGEDIVIGSPIAGRRHADLESVIGMFVNTLALRNYPSGEKTFATFLEEIKSRTLGAFDNQDYP
ncbi:MAG: amino acid adenylation domain-containing protein, partial [bacterium]|nr:amino acid adenylation domain-containing protein [bacterium]